MAELSCVMCPVSLSNRVSVGLKVTGFLSLSGLRSFNVRCVIRLSKVPGLNGPIRQLVVFRCTVLMVCLMVLRVATSNIGNRGRCVCSNVNSRRLLTFGTPMLSIIRPNVLIVIVASVLLVELIVPKLRFVSSSALVSVLCSVWLLLISKIPTGTFPILLLSCRKIMVRLVT